MGMRAGLGAHPVAVRTCLKTHWSAYDGQRRRLRAEALRAVCACGARPPNTRWTGMRSATGRCTRRTPT